ncbi:MAG: glyoxalase superfamily protein [Aeromicrobium sp.]|jgi:catechol 2,3-dioxygenase-like lactoylglutathione lyase family enzyme
MVSFEAAIPMLRVSDEAVARDFYVGHLGFSWDWESRLDESSPLYCQVSRGDLRIHLTAHVGDGTPGTHLFLPVTGLDDLHAELLARRSPHSRPGIETVPWGRVMTVVDPFSNHLNFTDWSAGGG